MAFNYYRKSDAGQFSFIRIPKALMTEESFDSLSLQSKLLYVGYEGSAPAHED